MNKKFILLLLSAFSLIVCAQNTFHVYMKNGSVVDYSVAEVDSVVFVKKTVTDPPVDPNPIVSGSVKVTEYGGWFESGYAEWTLLDGADSYNVYYKSATSSSYTQADEMLVRSYGSYARVDVLGLKAGTYDMKIVPVVSGKEAGDPTVVSFIAQAYDRAGFAHFNNAGVGAYNDDGTLKSDAVVIYLTEKNKSTLVQDVQTSATSSTSCTGLSAVLSALQKGYETRPFCIRLVGTITASGVTGSGDANNMLLKASNDSRPVKNVTIEGVGDDATCYGFGIRAIRAQSFELRNVGIMLFGDDGIAFETNNKYVWVHNNDIFYGSAGSDADQVKGDGSLDLKNDSKYMTLSYNHFWDSGKMSLCGMTSETGPNYISYHHNWFDHSDSRHPRIRTMSVHVYNNYFDGVSKYGVGVTSGANAFVEANYYRNISKPMMSSMQGTDALGEGTFSGEDGGMIKSYNNYYVEKPSTFSFISQNDNATSFDAYEASSRSEKVPTTYKTVQGGTSYDNFDTDASLMYAYTPDEPSSVASVVKEKAGRMAGGDFKWTFNNSVDDASYAMNQELMEAIRSYKTKMVLVYGE